MAFFGITALGPQNIFAQTEINFRNMQIFEEKDFQQSWDKINGKGAEICLFSKIELILKDLFHGEIPKNDLPSIQDALNDYKFQADSKNAITYQNYIDLMLKLRDDAETEYESLKGKPKPTCEFTSSAELQEKLNFHRPVKYNLQQKQTLPLTAMQEVSKYLSKIFLLLLFTTNKFVYYSTDGPSRLNFILQKMEEVLQK